MPTSPCHGTANHCSILQHIAAFCTKARTVFSHLLPAKSKIVQSCHFSTIWKLIRGSLTPRPPLDYLNAHLALKMEVPIIAAYCNILYRSKNNFLSSSLSSKMFQSFPNHERFLFSHLCRALLIQWGVSLFW